MSSNATLPAGYSFEWTGTAPLRRRKFPVLSR
jgi:hypothetical protein